LVFTGHIVHFGQLCPEQLALHFNNISHFSFL